MGQCGFRKQVACGHGERGEVMATPFPEDVPVVVRALRDVVRALGWEPSEANAESIAPAVEALRARVATLETEREAQRVRLVCCNHEFAAIAKALGLGRSTTAGDVADAVAEVLARVAELEAERTGALAVGHEEAAMEALADDVATRSGVPRFDGEDGYAFVIRVVGRLGAIEAEERNGVVIFKHNRAAFAEYSKADRTWSLLPHSTGAALLAWQAEREALRARVAELEAECTESGPSAWLDAVLRCHFERLEAVKAERRCPLDPGPGGE